MKINNPTKYFPETGSAWNINNLETVRNRATLVSRGDIIKKYADKDSNDETQWHFNEDTEHDSWVKFSFDGGGSWPLKFRYKNTLLMKFYKEGVPERCEKLMFDFGSYSAIDYSSIRNGRISLYFIDDEGYATNLPFYKYKFDDDTATLSVYITVTPPSDTVKTMLLIELDGHSAMAMAVPTPVFSSTVGVTPMAIDDHLGYYYSILSKVNAANSSINTTSSLNGVKNIKLKLKSADSSLSPADVHLRLTASGQTEPTDCIFRVGPDAAWFEVTLARSFSGILNIARINDSDDKLAADCELLDIIVTIFE